MKKLLIVIAALAMVVSFLPKVEAGETAELGLTVGFDLSYPPKIDQLAKALAEHQFDMDMDGDINNYDQRIVGKFYDLAIEYAAYLPDEVFRILDQNGDGVINAADKDFALMEVRVYVIDAEIGRIAQKAEWYYKNAVESGDPQVIKEAIDVLRQLHAHVKDLIGELEEIGQIRPDLIDFINDVFEKARSLLDTIDGYIEHLMSLLYPLKIWSDPEGPFEVVEGEKLSFDVFALDLDSQHISLEHGELPDGATFYIIEEKIYEGGGYGVTGRFNWKPKLGQAQDEPYVVVFEAINVEGEVADLKVKITVSEGQIISIELEPTTWDLKHVKLGEKRHNLNDIGYPIHAIKNAGNVEVMTSIRYGQDMRDLPIHPGLEQGLDTFITEVYQEGDPDPDVLPPDGGLKITSIKPDEKAPLHLIYGAPTELSAADVQGHEVKYELRAYGIIKEYTIE